MTNQRDGESNPYESAMVEPGQPRRRWRLPVRGDLVVMLIVWSSPIWLGLLIALLLPLLQSLR